MWQSNVNNFKIGFHKFVFFHLIFLQYVFLPRSELINRPSFIFSRYFMIYGSKFHSSKIELTSLQNFILSRSGFVNYSPIIIISRSEFTNLFSLNWISCEKHFQTYWDRNSWISVQLLIFRHRNSWILQNVNLSRSFFINSGSLNRTLSKMSLFRDRNSWISV